MDSAHARMTADRVAAATGPSRPPAGAAIRGAGIASAGMRPSQVPIQRCGIGSSCDCPPHDKQAGIERDLHRVTAAGGTPLPEASRARMESAFSFDFAAVRVHTGPAAHDAAGALEARALTAGTDILFRRGEYRPGSPRGDWLLAHELAHVVQQAHGVPQGIAPGASGHLEVAAGLAADRASPAAEREARGAARMAANGEPVPALSHQPLAIARDDNHDAGTATAEAPSPAGPGTGPADAPRQGPPQSGCFSCFLEGGMSICCPTGEFEKSPQWDQCSRHGADKYDSCMKETHDHKSCLTQSRCFICQCLGRKYCQCAGTG